MAMNALHGHGSAVVLQGAAFDLDTGSPVRGGRGLAANIRDLGLIALAWVIFIGIILHPGAQLFGIVVCGLALLVGSVRGGIGRRGEI
jgi:hypothetical protein